MVSYLVHNLSPHVLPVGGRVVSPLNLHLHPHPSYPFCAEIFGRLSLQSLAFGMKIFSSSETSSGLKYFSHLPYF